MAETVVRDTASHEGAPAGVDRAILSRESFHSLYHATATGLRRYLLRLAGNREDAEDLLQETYVRLLTTPVPVMEPAAMKSYLYRMATNLTRDGYRREGRQRSFLSAWTRRESRRQEAAQSAPEQASDLENMLSRLKPRERELLWLAHVEGFKHREIADIVGLKPDSIRPMLFRARQSFAKMLRAGGLAPSRLGRG